MSQEQEFRDRIQRISGLVRKLDSISDPALRAAAKELIESIMDLHGAAMERALEIVAAAEHGAGTIDSLGEDPLVGSLLLLYGLHPLDFETRVLCAVEKVQSTLRSYGGRAELVGITEAAVRLRVRGIGNASAAKVARSAIEEEIYACAPDLVSLDIQGLEQFAAPDFVPLEKLIAIPSNGSLGHPVTAGEGAS